VAFNVGGVSDIVEHEINGLTVKYSDVDMFAEALIGIIENSTSLLPRKAISARAHLKYSSDTVAFKYMQYYTQVFLNG
jgi:glycosyltransferase involved in cell wall biosynthesis